MSPRTAETNQAMRESSRKAILEAAVAVFSEAGPQQATTDAIASRAGVAKGLVFAHFGNKDTLLQAVIEEKLSEALRFWRDLPALAGRELLELIANRALERALEHPDAFRLYYALFFQPGAPAAVQRAIEKLKPEIEQYYRVVTAALREAGSTHPQADAVLFQAALSGLVQNLVIQPELARKPSVFPRKRLVARLTEAFVP